MNHDRDDLEFGPSGYLPERASKRARKIVLRAPLGAQWVWASVVAGAIVLVAGLVFLGRADDEPAPPFERIGALEEVTTSVGGVPGGPDDVLIVTEGGRPRAFDIAGFAHVPAYCDASRRLEAADGRMWTLTGRGLAGAPSLAEYPVLVSDGDLYVDLSAAAPGPPPADEDAEPACAV